MFKPREISHFPARFIWLPVAMTSSESQRVGREDGERDKRNVNNYQKS